MPLWLLICGTRTMSLLVLVLDIIMLLLDGKWRLDAVLSMSVLNGKLQKEESLGKMERERLESPR